MFFVHSLVKSHPISLPLSSTGATSDINIGIVIDANPTPIPTIALPIKSISFDVAAAKATDPTVKNTLAKIDTIFRPNLSFSGPPRTAKIAAVPTVTEIINSW